MPQPIELQNLYMANRARLLAFYLSKGVDYGRSEEFVQDVFVRYQGAGYELDAIQSRVALFRIARNLFNDELRRARVRRHLGIADEQLLEIAPDLDAASDDVDQHRNLSAKEELARVMQRLEELPPKCREVFIDFRFRSLNQKEIAQRRGISVSMVEKHVANAIAKLSAERDA